MCGALVAAGADVTLCNNDGNHWKLLGGTDKWSACESWSRQWLGESKNNKVTVSLEPHNCLLVCLVVCTLLSHLLLLAVVWWVVTQQHGGTCDQRNGS